MEIKTKGEDDLSNNGHKLGFINKRGETSRVRVYNIVKKRLSSLW